MAKLAIKKATTDVTVYLFIQASNVTTGAGLTGLTFETANLVASYVRPLAARQAITLATLAAVDSAHSDGGFIELDATNMPGVYRLDLPDAVCATGVNSAVVMLKGAANMAPVLMELQLLTNDPNDIATATALATVDTVVDGIVADMADVTEITTPLAAVDGIVDAIKAKTDSLTFTTPNKVDASATIDPTGLATSADLAVVDENVDAIKEKTDQMAFTVPNKIDASATVDPTGIATSEELEIIGEKVDNVLDKLNVSSVEFVTSVVGSTITILRGDTLTASLLNLGSMESYVSLDFTVKASTHQSDDAALIRVRKNASGLTDGLLRLNGAAHTTGTDGSITINDAPTGDITIMLKAGVTDDLVPGTYVYDIQLIEANGVSTLTTGTLIVSADVTRLVA